MPDGGALAGGAFGVAATTIAGWFTYLGVRRQAAGAKEASSEAAAQRSQDRALEAWENLLAPHIEEIRRLRDQSSARDAHDLQVDLELRQLRGRTTQLERENDRLLTMSRVIARWAVKLRDKLESAGIDPGATPHELETLQALEDATPRRRPGVASDDRPADESPDLS